MPNGEVLFHLDYLKITIFDQFERVMELVESCLQERAGLDLGGWIERGPGDRWEHIMVGDGPITLLSPKKSSITYTMVELKGHACAAIGASVLGSFLASISIRDVRWHCVRVDLAFDHVKIDPRTFFKACEVGNFNSRCLNVSDRSWMESSDGQTAYLGRRDQRKARRIRVYNRRGYNRLEAEIRGDWAKAVGRTLSEKEVSEWPLIAIGHVRGIVDFVDRSADQRADRCPLLPWWAEFVGGVERIKNLPEEDGRKTAEEKKLHLIGQSESRIIACAKRLWPILEAFGADYLEARIRHHAREKITDEFLALAEKLKQYRGCGLAGLPGDPDDDSIPI